eukprot:jgi/Picsp_1/4033/NSC_01545-R1_protein
MPREFAGCCAHDHDCEELDCGGTWTLNKYIDLSKTTCLNEAQPGSCKNIFRAWDQRLDPVESPLESEIDDPEILLHVVFTGSIKLKALTVIGGSNGRSPEKLRLFANRDDLDFSVVRDMDPVQEWDLMENENGTIEYPVKVSKFNGVHSLDLHFPSNYGADTTEIRFIAFKGEYEERRREAVNTVYESKPMPSDHQVPEEQKGMFSHYGV